MKEYIISSPDEGQTVIKYLEKVLPGAKGAILFKALRKKNIVLNEKKTLGKEVLKSGDSLKVYFSDETVRKFTASHGESRARISTGKKELKDFEKNIVYEDEGMLVINKPAGLAIHPSMRHYTDNISSGVKFYFDKILLLN